MFEKVEDGKVFSTTNPGSTSDKIAIFLIKNGKPEILDSKIVEYDAAIANLPLSKQLPIRIGAANQFLSGIKIDFSIGRGGVTDPIPGGVFRICPNMINDLKNTPIKHASNLGAPIALEIAKKFGLPEAYIVNGVSTDELAPENRLSGCKQIPRQSKFHALMQKGFFDQLVKKNNLDPKKTLGVFIHSGGGSTCSFVKEGRFIQVNDGIQEGGFSGDRANTVPIFSLLDLAYKLPKDQLKKMLKGNGGLISYCNHNNFKKLFEDARNGDEISILVKKAFETQLVEMIFQRVGCMKMTLLDKSYDNHNKIFGASGGVFKDPQLRQMVKNLMTQHFDIVQFHNGSDFIENEFMVTSFLGNEKILDYKQAKLKKKAEIDHVKSLLTQ